MPLSQADRADISAPSIFADPLSMAEALRLEATPCLSRERRNEMGQFLTPAPLARLLASMLACDTSDVHLLDAGAGVGSLFAAVVSHLCRRDKPPNSIHVVAYEIDPLLADYADQTLRSCRFHCERCGIRFSGEVKRIDFLRDAVRLLETNVMQETQLVENDARRFTCVVQNPPYRKIHSDSEHRLLLRRLGLETTNLYTGFLFAAMRLMRSGGELGAIAPRSFCNGSYFRAFREQFLSEMALQRLHLFETRQEAFKDDGVLQEILMLRATKTAARPETVTLSAGTTVDEDFLWREAPYHEVIQPNDSDRLIRIVPDETARQVVQNMARFVMPLTALGLNVSTGRVVDFRAAAYVRPQMADDTAPLLWPQHLSTENGAEVGGYARWPRPNMKKPNALVVCPETEALLVPNGNYVLVKRFSAKEQNKRIVASVYEGARFAKSGALGVGFENHLNYFHAHGSGLDMSVARGLAVFLNSTMVDEFFRMYSGHTQVNAADLRGLHYPNADELRALGAGVGAVFPDQDAIDGLIERVLMATETGDNATLVKKQIDKALNILGQLGLPTAQRNERSALTLLALLDLKPGQNWSEAGKPLLGITPIMEFAAKHYGKNYAPNTRETVRRFTVHQFLEAGLLIANPDKKDRPINSPHNVYQIEASALELLRTFGTAEWEQSVAVYLASTQTLKERYAKEREMIRIPIQIMPGQIITLSPGGQNVLVERIVEDFCPHYLPGSKLLYVGDTDNKFAYFDQQGLAALGVNVDEHGKMPDVIVHHTSKNWLILIEAVTSHGPVNAKRHEELKHLFRVSSAGLIFVTTFLTRKAFAPYAADISWETEVWFADSPTHLIHFNGERFLGPY